MRPNSEVSTETLIREGAEEYRLLEIEKQKAEIERQETEVEVLFGDMIIEPGRVRIITIEKKATCKIKDLDVFCEKGVEKYDSYLVPSLFRGGIIYQ